LGNKLDATKRSQIVKTCFGQEHVALCSGLWHPERRGEGNERRRRRPSQDKERVVVRRESDGPPGALSQHDTRAASPFV
jgi:hypothetical protein